MKLPIIPPWLQSNKTALAFVIGLNVGVILTVIIFIFCYVCIESIL